MTRIEVDFNTRDERGLIPAPVADINGAFRIGDMVEAFDEDGNRCSGRIAQQSGAYILIDPVWATFTTPDASRLRILRATGLSSSWVSGLSVVLTPTSLRPSVGSTSSGDADQTPPSFSGSRYQQAASR